MVLAIIVNSSKIGMNHIGIFMKDWGFKQIENFIPDIYKYGDPKEKNN